MPKSHDAESIVGALTLNTPWTVASFYSGAGGMDLGFAQAGFIPVWANDIDGYSAETYNYLVGGFVNGNKHVATVGDIRRRSDIPGHHEADVVIGGPPCQGFSVAGQMDPNDPRSRHVWDFLQMVERIEPLAFVMENVKAVAVNRRWNNLRDALVVEATSLGYQTEIFLLNAADYGVPQLRERMFLVGFREGVPRAPTPISGNGRPTLRSVLEGMPPYGAAGNNTLCRAKITTARKPVLRKSPFAGMLFNGQGRPMNIDRPAPTLPASMGGNRTPILDQRQLDEGATPWVVGYHRHLIAGGSVKASVPKRLRRITVEEAAAIQSFPEGTRWFGPQSAKFRQIGNAVPPLLAYHVALAVRDSLSRVAPEREASGDLLSEDLGGVFEQPALARL